MQMMANRAMGVVVTQVGDFVAGQMHFEKALSLYEREEDGSLGARFLTDPFASTSALLSITFWVSGYPERAAKMSQQALGFGEDLHHVHTSGLVHHFAAHLEALSGNPEGVLRHVEAMKALARQHRVQAWRSYWTIWEGWARGQKGEHGRGIELMREGIALQEFEEPDLSRRLLHEPDSPTSCPRGRNRAGYSNLSRSAGTGTAGGRGILGSRTVPDRGRMSSRSRRPGHRDRSAL